MSNAEEREGPDRVNQPWEADVQITQPLIRALLEKQFPELRPDTVRFIAAGWDNAVFCVNERYIFRFPRRKAAVPCMETEIEVLPELARHIPVATSAPAWLGRPSPVYPYPFAGYVMLPGQPPHLVDFDPSKRAAAAEDLADFLAALHGLAIKEMSQTGLPDDIIGRLNLEKRIPMLRRYLHDAVSSKLIEEPRPFEEMIQNSPTKISPRTVVVHGDLNFRNFLVDDTGRLTGVIDWGDVHLGHAAVDLAIVYGYLPEEGRRRFYARYGPVDDETIWLAKFRAAYTNLYLLVYAHDIGDERQLLAARTALDFMYDV